MRTCWASSNGRGIAGRYRGSSGSGLEEVGLFWDCDGGKDDSGDEWGTMLSAVSGDQEGARKVSSSTGNEDNVSWLSPSSGGWKSGSGEEGTTVPCSNPKGIELLVAERCQGKPIVYVQDAAISVSFV